MAEEGREAGGGGGSLSLDFFLREATVGGVRGESWESRGGVGVGVGAERKKVAREYGGEMEDSRRRYVPLTALHCVFCLSSLPAPSYQTLLHSLLSPSFSLSSLPSCSKLALPECSAKVLQAPSIRHIQMN